MADRNTFYETSKVILRGFENPWWGYYVPNIGSKDSQKENSV
jgi:hypothetical protein